MKLDALFLNGRFHTVEPARPTARALGVVGEHIVGLDDELEGCSADAIYDLDGAPVIPGLHDAHYHLSLYGQALASLDVSPDAAGTLDELYDLVAERAAQLPADSWVLGVGYEASKLGGHPDPDALDRSAGGRPVWLVQASYHGGVAGRSALRRMGINEKGDIPVVDGGHIGLGPGGRPNGVITERARDLVYAQIGPTPFEEYVEAIGRAARASVAAGLTSVTEPGIGGTVGGNTALAAFQEARARGLLDLRVTVMPKISALHEPQGDAAGGHRLGLDLGLRTGLGDDWLRVGGVKILSDGSDYVAHRRALLRLHRQAG